MRRPRFAVPVLLSAVLSPTLICVPAAVLAPLALSGCGTEVQEGPVPPDPDAELDEPVGR